MKAPLTEINKVSYIKMESCDERIIPLQPCYLGNSEWESWVSTEQGLLPLKIVDVVDACYFSKQPAREGDVYIDFINLIMKRAYFKDLAHFEHGIIEDINNLSASITKINLFHEAWRAGNKKVTRRFVTTEIEYILKVCRSIFDLLQEVIMRIWSRFRYIDPNLKTKKLVKSFASMVLKDEKLSTTKQIAEKFLLPKPLAEFYNRNGSFFLWLRSLRDKISHGGNNIELLYIMDDGFAVPTESEPFKGLQVWDDTELKPNNLGSLRSVISYITLNTLGALEDFSLVIQSIMQLPPDIAPDYNIYIRGENLEILLELQKYTNTEAWIKI
ncbi:hypothetical protein HBN76_00855 [Pseudomonas sp. WS 5013]|uniref:hypothetical protein n=1 Tax=Pseudomonas sp. WS 5013 TaxID=2717475 RepID=UPI001474EC04|nr:hypothetical protein [Pseudomonas sp. WS 5013]NMY39841.1 hypothetical protein [Pseudomonas sp. WS 5013]